MRILLILLFISFNSFNSFAQEDDEKLSKFYMGIGGGAAFRKGDINLSRTPNGGFSNSYMNNYFSGINLTLLNLGYRINETFGVTVNLNTSGHRFGYFDKWINYSTISITYLSIGGILSIPTKHFTIDIKPQYAPRVLGFMDGEILDYIGPVYEFILYGRGFVFGNSIVRSTKKGISYSLDIDYLTTRFDEVRIDGIYYDDNSTYNSFRIGVGVRYNFRTK